MAKLNLASIKAAAKEAAKTGRDVGVQTAGGDFKPPAAGKTRLRFIEYVEVGVHTKRSKLYGDKTKPMAQFGFELSGPKHPPKKLDDGRLIPDVIRFEEPIGYGKKNNYSKLFKLMSADFPTAKNFGQLLGEAFRGEVFHRKWKRADGTDGVSAELKNEVGFSIAGTTYENEEGEAVKLKVDEAVSDFRYLDWENADVDQWDSLYIGGQFDDGNTKNKVQERIKAAENFEGSAVYEALIEAGREEELTPAPVIARGAAPAAEKAEPEEVEEVDEEPVQEAPKKAPAKAVAPPKTEVKAKPPAAKKTAPKAAKAVEEDDGSDPLAGV